MSNAEEYLKKNVKDILQPMIKKICEVNPSEPVIIFFINIFSQKIFFHL